jgi:hypothetical protein
MCAINVLSQVRLASHLSINRRLLTTSCFRSKSNDHRPFVTKDKTKNPDQHMILRDVTLTIKTVERIETQDFSRFARLRTVSTTLVMPTRLFVVTLTFPSRTPGVNKIGFRQGRGVVDFRTAHTGTYGDVKNGNFSDVSDRGFASEKLVGRVRPAVTNSSKVSHGFAL